MEAAIIEPMSTVEREYLARRAAAEAASGRLLLGVHFVFIGVMLAIAASYSRLQARGPLFVAALLGLSGAGWFVYIRLLDGWIRRDLASGQIAFARVRLVRKARLQRKASAVHRLYLDPPLPGKSADVGAAVYDGVSEGDQLNIRYFPISKILFRVEKI